MKRSDVLKPSPTVAGAFLTVDLDAARSLFLCRCPHRTGHSQQPGQNNEFHSLLNMIVHGNLTSGLQHPRRQHRTNLVAHQFAVPLRLFIGEHGPHFQNVFQCYPLDLALGRIHPINTRAGHGGIGR